VKCATQRRKFPEDSVAAAAGCRDKCPRQAEEPRGWCESARSSYRFNANPNTKSSYCGPNARLTVVVYREWRNHYKYLGNQGPLLALFRDCERQEAGPIVEIAMWTTLFLITVAVSIGCGVAAVLLQNRGIA
jgi:hypothetical protein